MIRNFFKIAWRNLLKNKVHSFINIAGLATGMAVAMLIGLWIYDELSYDKNFQNYDRIASVMQHITSNGTIETQPALPYLLGDQLRKDYGSDFKYISMSSWTSDHVLAWGDKKLIQSGNYMEPQITEMLSLKMLRGTRSALQDPHAIILSASAAKSIFGTTDPMNKVIKIDNRFDVMVTGVYENLPYNSSFNNLNCIASWKLHIDNTNWVQKLTNPWGNNSFQCVVQIADNADIARVSAQIKNIRLDHVSKADLRDKPAIFLQPMVKWHLYSKFKNGVNVGGRIEFVWLFGTIGFFVLLLACINFMNLNTARSEKRAKEIGVRKAVGSLRGQLIWQFFVESFMITLFAFACSLALIVLALPYFNEVAGKHIHIMWGNPLFWLAGVGVSLITGLLAGFYPALYLSSFQPVKVLKGTFFTGRSASLPRKILVVTQFTISTILIIGTIVVFRQVQFAKSRPVGYNRSGLITVPVVTEDVHKHFDVISDALKRSGAVTELAETSSATTYVDEFDGGFDWQGKDPALQTGFGAVFVSVDFGKTVGWKIKEGRDFSRKFNESASIILNEKAAKFIGVKNLVGKTIRWFGRTYTVIGIIHNMVMESPYDPVSGTVFVNDGNAQQVIQLRINPDTAPHDALQTITSIFNKFNPAQPFNYTFVDADYAKKFGQEERIGKLVNFFAILAIFISCLGLYGMASFIAGQRTKEISVRKILGASVLRLWILLSKEFVVLIIVSLTIASPLSWYVMNKWLLNYSYHIKVSWWIFAATAIGAILITLVTVSYQSLKAAFANPIKSLKAN